MTAEERAVRIVACGQYALRLDVQKALQAEIDYCEDGEFHRCHPERFGDVVLARRDAPASYHLCATHDDALQGVTLVTRGIDLRAATDIQRLLQVLMDWPAPKYSHHRLLKDETGRRLAKRDRSLTLRSLRADGISAQEVIRRIDQSQ
jgi:glutamyl-Q tRNA(Asp) synthetase